VKSGDGVIISENDKFVQYEAYGIEAYQLLNQLGFDKSVPFLWDSSDNKVHIVSGGGSFRFNYSGK
jgi:hypothetical protein